MSTTTQTTDPYLFEGGFPTPETIQRAYDGADLNRAVQSYRFFFPTLSGLAIFKGRPFAPDERMTGILEQAARIGNGQLRVQSFADRRPDRVVWPDRQWQWAALRFENGDFYADSYLDTDAREKWFFQAIGASPAMFRRPPGPGRCTGWGCATPTAPTSMAAGPTSWPSRSRCRPSCSGRSRSMTP